jgi:hypothetical protein
MKLCECPWWPRKWITKNDQDISSAQVAHDGIFETCELFAGDLMLEVDYNGRTVVGRIGRSVNAPNLERVRDFLLDYSGDSMATIDDLEVAPDQFNTR